MIISEEKGTFSLLYILSYENNDQRVESLLKWLEN